MHFWDHAVIGTQWYIADKSTGQGSQPLGSAQLLSQSVLECTLHLSFLLYEIIPTGILLAWISLASLL